ncbi:uncharacterized protein A1O9_03040 [Exophiala aquamarina CBS 119918]|uniref:Conserved oligomeric Golgi complex subunit 1 n=1 Tax=Exophiala aquamarina CBS 119918 TaxID=1182545 RepID=A0A072PN11_9EURO|nr:uncharacterized protein A1O9_03040 [Exophiala aquamarina CBS 119918]KEF61474.1 hypothetical protein A1O9_03040 [Exophiala aquamarina CBS 119918]
MEPGTSITTWQQAFEEYRIPTTRAIEKQLKSTAARDKEKLRTLVGGSYRELLATSESIVVLDSMTKVTEEHLSTMGHNCRPPIQNLATKSPETKHLVLAELRLLQRCCATVATTLRAQRILLCSQILVVARLLLKSLGEHQLPANSLDLLRNKVSLLRRQLLRQVDAKLISPLSQVSQLVEALCSYCLVTSVSSDDALGHLHQLRLDKMRRTLSNASTHGNTIHEALRYQLISLQTFKALVGRPLVEAMTNLQKRPILTDQALRNLETLDLDRTISVISSDIQSFVPYFKRSALSPKDIQAKLETWSEEASRVLVAALDAYLRDLENTVLVLNLRKDLYTILLPSYFSTLGSSNMHNQMRNVLSKKLQSICLGQVKQLKDITSSLTEGVGEHPKIKSLWDGDITQAGANTRGSRAIKQVKSRHTGHHTSLAKATRSLEKWVSSIKITEFSFTELSKTSWRDLMEEPDEEDEQESIELSKQLGMTDAENHVGFLQESLREGLSTYETSIVEAATRLSSGSSDIEKAVALIRSIRMSIATLQDAFPKHMAFEKIHEIIPRLHEIVAGEVVRRLSQMSERRGKSAVSKQESLPEDMPSPKTFSTLRRLCEVMFDIGGTDIWSTSGVAKVKNQVQARVFDAEHKAAYVMNEFDEAYLRAALNVAGNPSDDTSHLAGPQTQAAQDYWGRTKLLFGLLS